MRRAFGCLLVAAWLSGAGVAQADVTVPNTAGQPVEEPATEPAASTSRGTLVHKPVLAGLVAMLFLMMGALAANDRHKKAAASSRRAPRT